MPANPCRPSPPDSAHRIHLGAATAEPGHALPLPRHASLAALAQFAGRLGFDPLTTVPLLLRDAVRPAHLAVTLASDGECLDDEAFLRNAWLALLQQPIEPRELAEFTHRLNAGMSRAEIVRGIANTEVLHALAR